jgi:hypothetical protein
MNRFEQKVKELLDEIDPQSGVDKFEAVRALGRGLACISVVAVDQRARRGFLQGVYEGISIDSDDCFAKYSALRASSADTPVPDKVAAEAYALLDQIFTRAGASHNG